MNSFLRLRKLCYVNPAKCFSLGFQSFEASKTDPKDETWVDWKQNKSKRQSKEWRCIDNCYWMIGYMCTTWWILCLLYSCLPGFQIAESPGVRLKREGVTALHPVVLVPGIITGGLELWQGRPCAEGMFRKKLWGGSFAEILKRYTHTHTYVKHPYFQNSVISSPICILYFQIVFKHNISSCVMVSIYIYIGVVVFLKYSKGIYIYKAPIVPK